MWTLHSVHPHLHNHRSGKVYSGFFVAKQMRPMHGMVIIVVQPKTNGQRRQINTNRYCITVVRIINLDCTIEYMETHTRRHTKELEI